MSLDKVAEAIWRAQLGDSPGDHEWLNLPLWMQGDYRELAQAAIDALELEPKFRYRAAGPGLVHSPCWETRRSEAEFALELFPDDYNRIESQQRWISGWIDADGGESNV